MSKNQSHQNLSSASIVNKLVISFPFHIMSLCKTNMADDVSVFVKEDLPKTAFPVFEDIRRQGKLCDVTLKVKQSSNIVKC